MPHFGGDADNRGGCVWVEAGSIWEISVPSAQFSCELKMPPQNKDYFFLKKNIPWGFSVFHMSLMLSLDLNRVSIGPLQDLKGIPKMYCQGRVLATKTLTPKLLRCHTYELWATMLFKLQSLGETPDWWRSLWMGGERCSGQAGQIFSLTSFWFPGKQTDSSDFVYSEQDKINKP